MSQDSIIHNHYPAFDPNFNCLQHKKLFHPHIYLKKRYIQINIFHFLINIESKRHKAKKSTDTDL